ncbi:MAG TPA: FAD-binding oxidoreductase [Pyrinomonadaceae bacterium]|jgi:sarcosine oxidase subunit beta
MTESADAVIIGGGVIGASVAYHLAESGAGDIIVVERAERQGMGSTGVATGGVRAQFATEINIRMSLYSIDFLSQFEEATGYASGYEPRGYLFIATNEEQLAALKKSYELQRALGLKEVELVTPVEIAARVPFLRVDDVTGGSFCQTDGFIKPLAVMRGFTGRAIERGARLWLGTEVVGIETLRGRVTGVVTTRGKISTRVVVCCAGAWAANVARLAGTTIPVEPLRRQLASVRAREPLPAKLPMVIDISNGFHFRPDGNAPQTNILLAWPDPSEEYGFKTEYDTGFNAKILAHARHRVPAWKNLGIDKQLCRAGLYEMTPDHHAIIGEAPEVNGLFVVGGFSGHGVMHSPAAGRMAAEMILDGHAKFLDAKPLSAARFKGNALPHETSLI